jgi:hypothetical protein
MPCYDLSDSWGHPLDQIDPSNTFHLFLQNLNGLSLTGNPAPSLSAGVNNKQRMWCGNTVPARDKHVLGFS